MVFWDAQHRVSYLYLPKRFSFFFLFHADCQSRIASNNMFSPFSWQPHPDFHLELAIGEVHTPFVDDFFPRLAEAIRRPPSSFVVIEALYFPPAHLAGAQNKYSGGSH